MDYKFLGKDITSDTLKAMTSQEREELCSELRDKILRTVSANGGHLASNLGAVELTVALLSVFDYKQKMLKFQWEITATLYPLPRLVSGGMPDL